ncbi:uncharacterized protein LOC141857600 [Brevipalpus obovatus]|uniref:uncharacterized protein LOC141857600 n=1 Tax=Brevipalpus obovatus TaxID=246614 RepID=UPI003D9FA240
MSDKSDDEILTLAERRYRLLREESMIVPAVSSEIDFEIPPPWFDADKFRNAQKLAQKYYISLNMSHLVGLLMVVQLPSGLEPLLATGNSKDIPKLFRRYLSTIVHVRSWYEEDPYKEGSKAYKSIRQVRRMHARACEMMNKKTGRVIGRDRIWVSQWEMAITQWAFIGVLILYPKDCGGHSLSDGDLELLNYFWRFIGYLHGIEDRFNICNGNLRESRALYKLILDREYRAVIGQNPHPAPVGYEMAKGIAKSLRPLNPSLRWQTFLKHFYTALEIPVEIPLKRVHRFRYSLLSFLVYTGLKSRMIYAPLNSLLRWNVRRQEKKRDQHEKMLTKKYPDEKYESGCPYAIDLDYIDAFQTSDMPNKTLEEQSKGVCMRNNNDNSGDKMTGNSMESCKLAEINANVIEQVATLPSPQVAC